MQRPIRLQLFQSTLPVRGATSLACNPACILQISIHTPREGSDVIVRAEDAKLVNISIHTPREGSDEPGAVCSVFMQKFQSTLPVRGATSAGDATIYIQIISIHTPREGSDRHGRGAGVRPRHISIHTPREGSDGVHLPRDLVLVLISIHTPREGSDSVGVRQFRKEQISIHTPREGSDPKRANRRNQPPHFNPHSP